MNRGLCKIIRPVLKSWRESWCSLLKIREHTIEVHFQVGPIGLQCADPASLSLLS